MTVAMPSSPQMEGCYSVDTAVGKIPLGLGQYVYMSSGGTLTDNEGSGVVMAIPLEDPSDFTNVSAGSLKADKIIPRTIETISPFLSYFLFDAIRFFIPCARHVDVI